MIIKLCSFLWKSNKSGNGLDGGLIDIINTRIWVGNDYANKVLATVRTLQNLNNLVGRLQGNLIAYEFEHDKSFVLVVTFFYSNIQDFMFNPCIIDSDVSI